MFNEQFLVLITVALGTLEDSVLDLIDTDRSTVLVENDDYGDGLVAICIQIDEFCIKNDELCIKMISFVKRRI